MLDPFSPSRDVGLEIAGGRFAIIPYCLATMRILVIEDETKVGCFIKRALEEESYAVDLCEDGAKGLEMALSTNYDSVIVDLMLPSLSGLDIV